MTAIIPFDSQLPAPSTKRNSGINKDVLGSSAASYPVLSIKGKVFTLVKGAEKKILTREIDGEEEPVQALTMTVARANTKYRVFYATRFVDGESDGKKPTCFSHDGKAPDIHAAEPQAKSCQACAHAVWGTGQEGKGTACAVKTRLAVVDPNKLDSEPFLLNVPAASRRSFQEATDAAIARGQDYNRMVLRVSFDKEAASPKLVFKPTGWLSEGDHEIVGRLYDTDIVREMVGVTALPDTASDDDAPAVVASKVVAAAKAISAPKAAEVTEDDIEDVVAKPTKTAKVEKPKAEKPRTTASDVSSLMADVDALLGNTDD